MNVDIRLPNIDASAPEASQLVQIRSYLYQFAGQLQWALNNVENTKNGNSSPAVIFEQNNDISQEDAENTFNSIKALIIKSADIVRAYEETIKANFNGTYFAGSDFGQYIEETNAAIVAKAKGLKIIALTRETGGKLASIAATDTAELAKAMSNTASIAESAGMSFESTSTFLTMMIETTRESAENLG